MSFETWALEKLLTLADRAVTAVAGRALIDEALTLTSHVGVKVSESPAIKAFAPAVRQFYRGEPQLGKLVESLAPDIKAGNWSVVIGDDVSGRPISQVVWNQMWMWSKETQSAETPRLFFEWKCYFHSRANAPTRNQYVESSDK